jgi:uncharacterized membrane protein YhaH (DUF805 family)
MGFTEAVRSVFSKYATFSGRARRSEFWYWQLFLSLLQLAYMVVAFVAVVATFDSASPSTFDVPFPLQAMSWLWVLGTFIPGVAVEVRRFHDLGKSGWTLLLPLPGAAVMMVGLVTVIAAGGTTGFLLFGVGILAMVGASIYQFILLVSPSEVGPNRYGPQPGAPIEASPLPAEVV